MKEKTLKEKIEDAKKQNKSVCYGCGATDIILDGDYCQDCLSRNQELGQ